MTAFQNFHALVKKIKRREIQNIIEIIAIIVPKDKAGKFDISIDLMSFQIIDTISYYNHRVSESGGLHQASYRYGRGD